MLLNNTYKAVRIIGEDYDLYYSVWCNNEHELYDIKVRGISFIQVKIHVFVWGVNRKRHAAKPSGERER